ncbi:ABC transporter permease [Yersinia artesiana]|uniref:ABC transporter permease n=1 Tax=Yersinia artesiana TaxID=2890315 RepID=UPI001F360CF7|nr:ABC transporter permease [Yersinia artesiana]
MNGFVSTPKSITRTSEVFESRYLIFQLIRRDFFVRYKQTRLGILWAIINPLVNLMLFLFVFDLLVKVPTPEYNAPFSAVLVVGVLFWNLFSNSMNATSDSLVNNVGLIKKVYFPRISLSISSVFVSLIDFIIALLFFIPCLLYIGVDINFKLFYALLPCVFFILLLGWGMGGLYGNFENKV